VVVVTFDAKTWADVAPGKGRLTHFATPKLLMAAAA
jgi:hypothetical protein